MTSPLASSSPLLRSGLFLCPRDRRPLSHPPRRGLPRAAAPCHNASNPGFDRFSGALPCTPPQDRRYSTGSDAAASPRPTCRRPWPCWICPPPARAGSGCSIACCSGSAASASAPGWCSSSPSTGRSWAACPASPCWSCPCSPCWCCCGASRWRTPRARPCCWPWRSTSAPCWPWWARPTRPVPIPGSCLPPGPCC
ncbi:hypothetical protein D3C76_1145660 [compost metagenome]